MGSGAQRLDRFRPPRLSWRQSGEWPRSPELRRNKPFIEGSSSARPPGPGFNLESGLARLNRGATAIEGSSRLGVLQGFGRPVTHRQTLLFGRSDVPKARRTNMLNVHFGPDPNVGGTAFRRLVPLPPIADLSRKRLNRRYQ